MIEMESNINEIEEDNIFDDNSFKQQVSLNVLFEEDILMLFETKRKSEIYIKTCDGMIASYEFKKKKAKEKIDQLEKKIKDNIFNFLDSGIKDGVIPKTYLNESDYGFVYKLPTANLIITKPQPFIEDHEVLFNWLESNHLDYISEIDCETGINWEMLKDDITVVNNSCILIETGEILPGISLTESKLIIKYVGM